MMVSTVPPIPSVPKTSILPLCTINVSDNTRLSRTILLPVAKTIVSAPSGINTLSPSAGVKPKSQLFGFDQSPSPACPVHDCVNTSATVTLIVCVKLTLLIVVVTVKLSVPLKFGLA